jgi:predicted phosphatase
MTNPTTSRLLYDHRSYYILGMYSWTVTKKCYLLLALREVKNYLLHLNIMNHKLVSKMLLSVMTFIDVN